MSRLLSRLIERKINDKLLDTYKVKEDTSVSHLMYADDILLFSEADPKSLLSIKEILAQFSAFSNLEVNAQKSSIAFSKICENDPIL